MTLTDPKAHREPGSARKYDRLTRAGANAKMREDVCVPSVEQSLQRRGFATPPAGLLPGDQVVKHSVLCRHRGGAAPRSSSLSSVTSDLDGQGTLDEELAY